MFVNDELKTFLETSSTIRSQSAVIAEWNMNIATNIQQVGNYRHRPLDASGSKYKTIPSTFDINDAGNYYTNATDADIVIDGGFNDADEPITLLSNKEKTKMLYSLEDCFKRFRPRSGINKINYFNSRHIHHANIDMAQRPRYYMADKNDVFKYWTSFRTEDGTERGIANQLSNGQYFIDDAAPYVVYKKAVPTNRVVVKMQTNVGSLDLGPFTGATGSISDPLYGASNQTTPVNWKVQSLNENNNWVDLFTFNAASKRKDGTKVIKEDGYVELAYGLIIPDRYTDIFIKAEEFKTTLLLPEQSINGYAYLIKENDTSLGTYYIWVEDKYETFTPRYGWYLQEETVDRLTNFVTDLTSPDQYLNTSNGKNEYREFSYINGLRVVATTMNKVDSTLDLIELSPRLCVDLSGKTIDFTVTKTAGDIGTNGLPVGQLLASTGQITIFDYDDAFNPNNKNSIIANYANNNIQIKFYDIVIDVNGYDYFIPVKVMYSEGFPQLNNANKTISLTLRDMFFYLESITAPQILVTDVSLSYAISLLLDAIGYSNYVFKRVANEAELIIPYFFIPPDKTIAEILNDLAISSQTAMFFDEYNNFVMMTKEYLMPTTEQRVTDATLYGSDGMFDNGVQENMSTSKLANIVEISSQDNSVYNDGKINYTTRYIQKTFGSLRQASMIDKDINWIYKPVLLWEAVGGDTTKSSNDNVTSQSSYVLGAIPLNSTLTDVVPYVANNQIQNNTMDLGEGVYWLTRNSGYFYANSEIIKYDAVQYSVSGVGNVWITNAQEYQNYFSKISFNGKIYPTGLIRIYAEPNWDIVNDKYVLSNGPVAKHGRGQFGTKPVTHNAGINSYWYDTNTVRGCSMKSQYLFSLNGQSNASTPYAVAAAGVNNSLASRSTRNGVIKNFLSNTYIPEAEVNGYVSTKPGTIQSSALVFEGPSFSTTEKPVDFLSYVYKPLTNKFKHFGTRMRIVGKVENNETRGQTPLGSVTYYVVTGSQPNQNINIGGGSGGLAVMINPETNNGYYFEIVALTENNISSYTSAPETLHNILFYKVGKDPSSTSAIPIKLWGGLTNILVDDGKFTGQYRMVGEQNPTVYDLAVEYQDIGSIRRFYLYINNKLITTVDDTNPLPVYNNMALFTRGNTRCMFENIYALTNNYAQNTTFALDTPTLSAIDDSEISANESFSKYAMSGIVQSTYLSGISPSEPPKYNMYFEEFGTIMREAAYFNVRYDKAYPALYAKLSPTFNRIKGYTVSGFRAGSYGAEFLIFNATDTALSLDETSGNYLRIQGITFTQQSQHELTVDDYYDKTGDFTNPEFAGVDFIKSPAKASQQYEDIKISRITYGKKDFVLDTPYVQTKDTAEHLLSWILEKVSKPRKSVGLVVFGMPTLQLGDIVNIEYKNEEGIDQISNESTRYVVYNIEYAKNASGPTMSVYLSEVA